MFYSTLLRDGMSRNTAGHTQERYNTYADRTFPMEYIPEMYNI